MVVKGLQTTRNLAKKSKDLTLEARKKLGSPHVHLLKIWLVTPGPWVQLINDFMEEIKADPP